MEIIAIRKFRRKHNKGDIVNRGDHLTVDEGYGKDLIQSELAVKDEKQLGEYQNKMRAELLQNKIPVDVETPEQRTEGNTGPAAKSETPEQRTQGKVQAKPAPAPDAAKPHTKEK